LIPVANASTGDVYVISPCYSSQAIKVDHFQWRDTVNSFTKLDMAWDDTSYTDWVWSAQYTTRSGHLH